MIDSLEQYISSRELKIASALSNSSSVKAYFHYSSVINLSETLLLKTTYLIANTNHVRVALLIVI